MQVLPIPYFPERDEYLAASLRCCPGQVILCLTNVRVFVLTPWAFKVIVGVVGLGHVEGIKSCWNKSIDRKALLTAPEIQNLRSTLC